MRRLFISLVIVCAVAARAQAPPWVPLEKGTIWVYEHEDTFTGSEVRKVRANVIAEVQGEELIGGKTYARILRRYQGMPGVDRITVYRRLAPEGLYIATKKDGKMREALELALPAALGGSWDYDDGTASKRQVADVVTVETPAGKFDKCLKVVRDFLTDVRRKNYTQESYYCQGIGEVKSVLVQNRPEGKVVTEERLVKSSVFAPKAK